MKSIFFAGSTFVTGDDIASALLEAGRALAEARLAQNVEIPVRNVDGSTAMAVFLIGPASQIVIEDAPQGGDELVDAAVLDELRALVRRLRPTAVVPDEQPPTGWDPEVG